MSPSTDFQNAELNFEPVSNADRPARLDPRRISIVVACRNESNHIRAFVDSLLEQDLEGIDWELIIAEGMSVDGTAEYLSELACGNSNITIIQNYSRIVSTGLNAAIRSARGDIILRMDAHTEYARDYIKCCLRALDRSGACNVGGPARTRARGLRARAIEAAYHNPLSTGGARFHDESYSGYVDTVPYGCWRKDTLLRLGLFDEQLVRNQDDELNLRLRRSGGKIWQSSEIVSWYRPRTTLVSLFHQYFQYGFWKVCVIRKHKIPASWRHLIPGGFVLVNLALLFTVLGLAASDSQKATGKLFLEWAVLLGLYAAGCLIAAIYSARRYGWQLLIYLPLTFPVFHFSYGLGFLAGLIYWPFAGTQRPQLGNLFEGDTR
jgi:glycosyltransferase involved in cell wall biosynthesis